MASACPGVGSRTWSPMEGNARTPRDSSYLLVPDTRSGRNVNVPTGDTCILRRGNGRSIRPKSFKPGLFGYGDRSMPIQVMYATIAPVPLGISTYPLSRGNEVGVPVFKAVAWGASSSKRTRTSFADTD